MAPASPPLTTLRRTSSPTPAQSLPASPSLALASASGQLVSPSKGVHSTKPHYHLLDSSPARSLSLNSPTTEYPSARVYDNAYTWERANQVVVAGSGSGSGSGPGRPAAGQHGQPRPLHPPGQSPLDSPPSPTSSSPVRQPTSKLKGLPALSAGRANIHNNNPNSSMTKVRTQAEVYADKHALPQHRRQLAPAHSNSGLKEDLSSSKENNNKDKDRSAGTKPIFDWIQRKLGARRATISEAPSSPKATSSPRARLPSMPKANERVNNIRAFPGTSRGRGRGRSAGLKNGPGGAGPGHAHSNGAGYGMKREDSGGISRADSRSVSMSLSTRSFVGTVERERRREANNPYPSIPIPRLAAAGMVSGGPGQADDATTLSMSMSLSYLSRSPRSRSRSHSLDSLQTDGSRSRRLSMAEEMESPVRRFRGRAFGGSIAGADDDASLRPFPPSHPASPTPSTSFLYRSGSNPMIPTSNQQQPFGTINGPGGARSRTNTFYSTWSGQGYDRRSYTSSSLDGYAYRPSSAGYPYSIENPGSRYGDHGAGEDDDDEDEERGRESRQDSTSTKPTTCISFDSGPAVGHIAQARGVDQDHTPLTPHTPVMDQGGATVTVTASPLSIRHTGPSFASANVSPRQVSRAVSPSSPNSPADVGGSGNSSPTPPTPTTPKSPISAFPSPARNQAVEEVSGPSSYVHPDMDRSGGHNMVQAPKHTNPHPVHNPRPSSPPGDNASMLTLASSTFGLISSASPSAVLSPVSTRVEQYSDAGPMANHALAQPIQLQSPSRTDSPDQRIASSAGELQHVMAQPAFVPHQGRPSVDGLAAPVATPAMNNPPSIHRLRETPLRPPSVTSPSIHWAVSTTAAEERDQQRPTSTYESGYAYGYAGYAGSTHLSTTAPSVSMSLRQWSLGGDRGMYRADRDASVRAVRRKGSWESYESGWSWRGLSGPASGTATGSAGGDTMVAPQTANGGNGSGSGWPRGLASPVGPSKGDRAQSAFIDDEQGAAGAMPLAAGGGDSQRGSVYTRDSWMTAQSDADGNAEEDDDEDEHDEARLDLDREKALGAEAGMGMVMVS
ncbi:hypothetical protein I317_00739 [Kwoniella heveanensis CBS 569]|nr:hypothetical protein I317_00739 [Kwoniella heveanensis CBS 569]